MSHPCRMAAFSFDPRRGGNSSLGLTVELRYSLLSLLCHLLYLYPHTL